MFLKEKNESEDLRDKQMLAGLYLSRFDKHGLQALGFSSFTEAFNTIGFALGAQPASIKNYRDEFDPVFSTTRVGWRNRPMREHCKAISTKYANLGLKDFSALIKSLVYEDYHIAILGDNETPKADTESSFAKRLITGQAAEKYFEFVHPTLPGLADYTLENVTKQGCGFDYKLRKLSTDNFLAVEVKGLNAPRGTITLTEKEYRVAERLSNKFYLFVVSNFRKKPSHNIYNNPLRSELSFMRQETQVIQVNWRAAV